MAYQYSTTFFSIYECTRCDKNIQKEFSFFFIGIKCKIKLTVEQFILESGDILTSQYQFWKKYEISIPSNFSHNRSDLLESEQ